MWAYHCKMFRAVLLKPPLKSHNKLLYEKQKNKAKGRTYNIYIPVRQLCGKTTASFKYSFQWSWIPICHDLILYNHTKLQGLFIMTNIKFDIYQKIRRQLHRLNTELKDPHNLHRHCLQSVTNMQTSTYMSSLPV